MDEDKDDDDNGMDQDKDKKDNGMDQAVEFNSAGMAKVKAVINEALKPLVGDVEALKKQSAAMDSATLLAEISKRDDLAKTLSQFVGTFDHKSLTLQGVAEYGVEKLELPCEKGQEVPAITAYLHNRQPPTQAALYAISNGTAQDGKPVDNPVDNYIAGGDQ